MRVDHLHERLARLDPKLAKQTSVTPVAGNGKVEFITVPSVRPRKGGQLGQLLFIGLVAAVVAKGILLAQYGTDSFEMLRRGLAAGSPEQRALALVLYPDPLTRLFAEEMTPAPEEVASIPSVRLRNTDGVEMLEALQPPAEGEPAGP